MEQCVISSVVQSARPSIYPLPGKKRYICSLKTWLGILVKTRNLCLSSPRILSNTPNPLVKLLGWSLLLLSLTLTFFFVKKKPGFITEVNSNALTGFNRVKISQQVSAILTELKALPSEMKTSLKLQLIKLVTFLSFVRMLINSTTSLCSNQPEAPNQIQHPYMANPLNTRKEKLPRTPVACQTYSDLHRFKLLSVLPWVGSFTGYWAWCVNSLQRCIVLLSPLLFKT